MLRPYPPEDEFLMRVKRAVPATGLSPGLYQRGVVDFSAVVALPLVYTEGDVGAAAWLRVAQRSSREPALACMWTILSRIRVGASAGKVMPASAA